MIKNKWFKGWRKSKDPSKQRKYRYNAPLHVRNKLMKSPLSKELRKKYNKRNVLINKGDRVKIILGNYKGTIGEVQDKDVKKYKIFIKGAERKKKDGTTIPYPIDPSNVIVLELNLDDKKRKERVESKK